VDAVEVQKKALDEKISEIESKKDSL